MFDVFCDTVSVLLIFINYSLIAQSVERRTVNPQVAGSSPARGAIIYKGLKAEMLRDLFILRLVQHKHSSHAALKGVSTAFQ